MRHAPAPMTERGWSTARRSPVCTMPRPKSPTSADSSTTQASRHPTCWWGIPTVGSSVRRRSPTCIPATPPGSSWSRRWAKTKISDSCPSGSSTRRGTTASAQARISAGPGWREHHGRRSAGRPDQDAGRHPAGRDHAIDPTKRRRYLPACAVPPIGSGPPCKTSWRRSQATTYTSSRCAAGTSYKPRDTDNPRWSSPPSSPSCTPHRHTPAQLPATVPRRRRAMPILTAPLGVRPIRAPQRLAQSERNGHHSNQVSSPERNTRHRTDPHVGVSRTRSSRASTLAPSTNTHPAAIESARSIETGQCR